MDKKYDFNRIDKEMQQLWIKNNTYVFNPDMTGSLYSIDTPPPTISGALHIGHIFSYTQAEIIARYKRMSGYNVFYPFGFDDNGLPTERLVEKEENIIARDLTREEFNAKCIEKIDKYTDEFKELWKSLGFSCDWNLQYNTISSDVCRLSQGEFLKLITSGDAYVKKAPIIWCTSCQTSIAQAELDDKTLNSVFHTIIFKHDSKDIHIATTRPEFLPACVAVLVNPQDERYKYLIGCELSVPIYGKKVKVIADDDVLIDKGTGAVMCCTFGDSTDIEWVRKYDLPILDIVTSNGRIESDIAHIGGLYLKEARKVLVTMLQDKNLLVESKNIEHSVSVHDKCSTPSEIISSTQWYISTLKYRDELLKYGAKIKWYPEYMKKKYDIWVENLKWDWCVSRQRFFGVPIPVWYCNDCGKIIPALEDQLPVNPISDKPPVEKCKCGCSGFTAETSVFDTWATSSLTPKIDEALARKAGYKGEFLPCSMRTHAHEIIRTWSFYTILRSFLHDRNIPWQDLMICGFVLAKKGEKLSKSKNNSIYNPKSLLEDYPADMIRFCAASTKLGTDTYFAEKELDDANRMLTKVWNVFKYVLLQLKDFIPEEPETLLPVDKWIIEKARKTMADAQKQLDDYEVGLAKQTITTFFWDDFCGNFVEISKTRIYNEDLYGKDMSNSGKYALYTSFLYIQKMLAIYMPHITEFIYQELYKNHEDAVSLHQLYWDKDCEPDISILEVGNTLLDIIFEIRKYKSERNLSLRTPIKKLHIYVPQNVHFDISSEFVDIKESANAEELLIDVGDLNVELTLQDENEN
ncbi:MAG: valine--tRNA ligase [Firmicutes bacterium]|nr:valine--tRNA ligase [Bacillota bacterium]